MSAISMVCEVFGPLSELVAVAGVIGLALSVCRALFAPDGEVAEAVASQVFRICGLMAAMGAFGTIASWLLGSFAAGNVNTVPVIVKLLAGF